MHVPESVHETNIYDVTIIGGGPAGLFGLFYACLRDMKALLIDNLPVLGGQLVTLYPEQEIYDVPGFPMILAKDLAVQFIEQAMLHRKQDIVLGERVETCDRDEQADCFVLETSTGRKICTRTVVVTTGAGSFSPNKLPLPQLEPLEDQFVFYCVQHKSRFAGKRLVIVGGGDSAFDWILCLHPIAREISLVHRRDGFRAHEESIRIASEMEDVKKYLFYEVRDVVLNEADEMEEVIIEENRTGQRLSIGCDALLANLGFTATIGPVKNWGLALQGNYILVNQSMETNIAGIFAAGDIATFPGKVKLIATGVAEAAIAVNGAKHFINPAERKQPMHSTMLFERKKSARHKG